MKKITLIFLVFVISIVKSQMSWINGISISPSNPTELDSITVFVDLSFAYSDCPLDHKYISILGNDIQSSSHHCQGPMAAICNTTDTLQLAPLPLGTYKLVHTSTSGSGAVPCTPGFVVDDVDSIYFDVVSSATSDVTFRVNMNYVSDNFTTPELNGSFNAWCGNCNPMQDTLGNLTWETTLNFPVGDTIEFKYSADNWSIEESLDPNDSCTNGDINTTVRRLVIPNQDTILPAVCWSSCDTCLPLPLSSNTIHDSPILVFPNPVIDELNIQHRDNLNIEKVIIYDSRGRLIREEVSTNFSLKELNRGTYIISIVYDGKTHHYFIAKN